jgi:hypothetical protein
VGAADGIVTGVVEEPTPLSRKQREHIQLILERLLPGWNERAQGDLGIEVGSSLDGDVRIYPNGVEIAWQSMTSAVDHLNAIQVLWLRAGQLHAFADHTLIRAALLGAATAAYLLDDSPGVGRRERMKRGALAALSDHHDHLEHQRAMTEMAATLGDAAVATHQGLIQEIELWYQRAKQVAREHGATTKQLDWRLSATTCIVGAAKATSRRLSETDRVRLQSGVRAVWQRGSADAHARTWQTKIRRGPDLSGPLGPDVAELVQGLQATALVLGDAWRIWDLRRQNHVGRLHE